MFSPLSLKQTTSLKQKKNLNNTAKSLHPVVCPVAVPLSSEHPNNYVLLCSHFLFVLILVPLWCRRCCAVYAAKELLPGRFFDVKYSLGSGLSRAEICFCVWLGRCFLCQNMLRIVLWSVVPICNLSYISCGKLKLFSYKSKQINSFSVRSV